MDLTDKSNSSRNHRSTKQSVSESSNLHNMHRSSSKSLYHISKVSGNCHKSLNSDHLTVKTQQLLSSNRCRVVKSRSLLGTLMPAYGSTFTAHSMSTLSRSGALLVVMLVAAALCSGVESKSVKIKLCSGMICRAHEFCDGGTKYCESCRPICDSRDESNQRICKRQCQDYLLMLTTSPPPPASLPHTQAASQEALGGSQGGSYPPVVWGIFAAVVVVLVGMLIFAVVLLRRVVSQRTVDPGSTTSSEDTSCKIALTNSSADNDNDENDDRDEVKEREKEKVGEREGEREGEGQREGEEDVSLSESGNKITQPSDSSNSNKC